MTPKRVSFGEKTEKHYLKDNPSMKSNIFSSKYEYVLKPCFKNTTNNIPCIKTVIFDPSHNKDKFAPKNRYFSSNGRNIEFFENNFLVVPGWRRRSFLFVERTTCYSYKRYTDYFDIIYMKCVEESCPGKCFHRCDTGYKLSHEHNHSVRYHVLWNLLCNLRNEPTVATPNREISTNDEDDTIKKEDECPELIDVREVHQFAENHQSLDFTNIEKIHEQTTEDHTCPELIDMISFLSNPVNLSTHLANEHRALIQPAIMFDPTYCESHIHNLLMDFRKAFYSLEPSIRSQHGNPMHFVTSTYIEILQKFFRLVLKRINYKIKENSMSYMRAIYRSFFIYGTFQFNPFTCSWPRCRLSKDCALSSFDWDSIKFLFPDDHIAYQMEVFLAKYCRCLRDEKFTLLIMVLDFLESLMFDASQIVDLHGFYFLVARKYILIENEVGNYSISTGMDEEIRREAHILVMQMEGKNEKYRQIYDYRLKID